MGIDVVFKENTCDAVVTDINSIYGEVCNGRAADDQSADDTARGEQGSFCKKLRHDAASFHADGSQDADFTRAFKHGHHQGVRDDRCGNAKDDQVDDDEERIGIIFKLDDELILFAPGENLVIVRLDRKSVV